MKIESLLKRGRIHEEFCEDAVFYENYSDSWIIAGVMDGCSSAKDSYFASAMFSKLLGKSCKTLPFLSKIQPGLSINELSPKNLGEFILNQIFEGVKSAYKHFLLDEIEILTTLLLMVINKNSGQAWINVSGDGFICCDNELIEIDQNNIPDYLSYHLEKDFESWFKNHTESYTFKNFERIAITTDGIIKLMKQNGKLSGNDNPVKTLLSINTKNTLDLEDAYSILQEKDKLIPFDDIGIVRVSVD